MQFVCSGDNLLEMTKPVYWEKQDNIIDLLSAELAQRAVKG